METRASYVLVGGFVLGLIATAVVFILWLGGGAGGAGDQLTYRVQFRGDVTGLEEGAKVRYRGIPVGTVRRIALSKTQADTIDVLVSVRDGTPIRTSTTAAIESQGLTGAPFIQLSSPAPEGGGDPAPLLVPKRGDPVPVIPGRTTGLARILEEFPKAVKAVTELTEKVGKLVDSENRALVTNILKSANRTMGNLEKASTEAEPALKAIRQLAGKADRVLDDVNKFTTTANAVAGDIRSITKKADKLVDSVAGGARAFAAMSWEIRNLIRENRRPIADFAATGLYEFSLFLTDMRKFVRSADRFIKRMENDPAGFFFGNRNKGFTTSGSR